MCVWKKQISAPPSRPARTDREPVLPQGLVGQDGHGVAEVQAPRLRTHGQTEAPVIVGRAERLRQPRRLLAEEQPAVRRKPGLRVVLRGLGGGQPQVCGRLRVLPEQIVQPVVVPHRHQMPVVQPRPLHGAVRDVEAQRPHQMQGAPRGGAGAGDVAAVLGDLRLDQYDMQHKRTSPLRFVIHGRGQNRACPCQPMVL